MWRGERRDRSSIPTGDDFRASGLRRVVVGLVAIKIAGLVVLLDPAGATPLLVKSVFSAGTAVILAALLALVLFRYGGAMLDSSRVHLVVAAFAAVSLASTLSAESPYVAVFGAENRYLGLAFLADMLILYAAVVICFRRSTDWEALALVIAAAGALSLGYGFAQRLGRDVIAWGPSATPPVGTLGDQDGVGQLISIMFGAALGTAALPARLPRIAAAVGALFALAAAIALAPRGTLLGIGAAVLLFPLVALKIRRMDRATIDVHLVRAVVVIACVTSVVAISPLAGRIRDAANSINVADRALVYESAVSMVIDRPVLGSGPDNFAAAYPRYRQPRSTAVLGEGLRASALSSPLQIAATLGLIGLFVWFLLITVAMRSLWDRGLVRAPAVAAPVLLASVAFLIHGAVAGDAIAVSWWPWLAFATAVAVDRRRDPSLPARRPLPRPAVVAAILTATIFAGTGIIALRSDRDARAAEAALKEGRPGPALVSAQAAVDLDPGRAERWDLLGRALELNGRSAAANDAYAEAALRAPYMAAYWSDLARSRAHQLLSGDASGGGAEAALDAAERGVDADPNSPRAHADLAEIANLTGAYELALGEATRAIRLDPGHREYEDLAIRAALSLADRRDGVNALSELLPLRDTAPLRVALAKLSLQLGDRDAARRHASRALELDPQDGDARTILGQTGG